MRDETPAYPTLLRSVSSYLFLCLLNLPGLLFFKSFYFLESPLLLSFLCCMLPLRLFLLFYGLALHARTLGREDLARRLLWLE